MHRHTFLNKSITGISNWLTDLNLSDVETCYKAVNTDLLKSLPLRSNDFRFEIELTFKLAKRRARIFEVPIRYLPRSYEEGKKIRARDGLLALGAMLEHALSTISTNRTNMAQDSGRPAACAPIQQVDG